MTDKVLLVLHQEQSTPGRVGYALRERGYELDIRRPRYGDPLPKSMADHAGAVIFGGPQSANDADDFIKAEVTQAMRCRWTPRGGALRELPGAKKRHEHFADRPVHDYGIRRWLSDFIDHWLALGQPRQLAAAE